MQTKITDEEVIKWWNEADWRKRRSTLKVKGNSLYLHQVWEELDDRLKYMISGILKVTL